MTMRAFLTSALLYATVLPSITYVQAFVLNRNRQSSERFAFPNDQTSNDQDIWLVRWDGCIADTVDWRIESGMKVTASTWPELSEMEGKYWLENKLRALSHVLTCTSRENEGYSVTCNYAYMTRMLLEEQALDQGRSTNCSGKYASKFHPQEGDGTKSKESSNDTGTRPLTVGEIAANWNQGGMLCDTLRVKYRCKSEKKKFGIDSMPILQGYVDEIGGATETQAQIPVSIATALKSLETSMILFVNHESDIPMSMLSLDNANIEYQVATSSSEIMDMVHSEDGPKVILAVTTNSRRSSDEAMSWNDILSSAPEGSTLHVVESSYTSLERHGKPLFGDYIPRTNNIGLSQVPGRNLSLHLASHQHSHPTETSQAVMNAWMDELSQDDFVEIIQDTANAWG